MSIGCVTVRVKKVAESVGAICLADFVELLHIRSGVDGTPLRAEDYQGLNGVGKHVTLPCITKEVELTKKNREVM